MTIVTLYLNIVIFICIYTYIDRRSVGSKINDAEIK